MVGFRIQGSRLGGAAGSTELWLPPLSFFKSHSHSCGFYRVTNAHGPLTAATAMQVSIMQWGLPYDLASGPAIQRP